MTSAIIYTRFSPRPEGRGEPCESCETQEAVCRRYASGSELQVVAVHHDRSVSGAAEVSARPGLLVALGALQHGDVLLVYRRDRLARDTLQNELICREVERIGARVVSASGEGNGDGPESALMRQMLAAFAEYERAVTAIRTSIAMRRHMAAGRVMSSTAPYGSRIEGKQLVPEPEEQDTLDRMVALSRDGEGPSRIASILNDEERPSRTGRWTRQQVHGILKRYDRRMTS